MEQIKAHYLLVKNNWKAGTMGRTGEAMVEHNRQHNGSGNIKYKRGKRIQEAGKMGARGEQDSGWKTLVAGTWEKVKWQR